MDPHRADLATLIAVGAAAAALTLATLVAFATLVQAQEPPVPCGYTYPCPEPDDPGRSKQIEAPTGLAAYVEEGIVLGTLVVVGLAMRGAWHAYMDYKEKRGDFEAARALNKAEVDKIKPSIPLSDLAELKDTLGNAKP